MSSVYDDLLAAIETQLLTVDNAGTIHTYQRFTAQMDEYLDMFKVTISGNDQIRGWMITLDDRNPVFSERDTFGVVHRTFNFLVVGIMGVSDADASEATFLNLCLTMIDAIEGNLDLPAASGVYSVDAASLKIYNLRRFGSHLCHYGEITIPIHYDLASVVSGAST